MDTSSAGRLLLVGCDADILARVRASVAGLVPDDAVTEAHSEDEARDAMSRVRQDCIVLDAGLALLHELLESSNAPAIVGLTDDRDRALEIIRLGAFDGVAADAELELVRAVRHALESRATRRLARETEIRATARRNLAPIGHFELDAELMPTYVNELARELSGLIENDSDSFRRALRWVHPDDLPRAFAELEKLKTGENVHTEHRWIRDGRTRLVDVRCVRVDDSDGRIIGYVGGVVDVTEQRRMAERERVTTAQLRAVFEHSPSAMWFKDLDSKYVFVNPQFAAYFGRDVGDFPGMTDTELVSARVAEMVAERDLAVLTTGEPIEFEDELPTPAGVRRISSVAFPVFDPDGAPIGVCGLADDVTKSREAEDRFRRSFDDAPVGMSLSRPDGTWLNVNRALAELLGYDRSELLDRSYSVFTHPDDREEDQRRISDLLRNGGTLTREKRLVRRDGSIVWVLSCVDIARDTAGRAMWALTHVLDITQRKRAEHELQRQQVDMLTIARVARDAGGAENPAYEVCDVAGRIVGASKVSLLEVRVERLRLTAATDQIAPLGTERTFDEMQHTSGLCARSRERLFVGDLGDVLSQDWGPNSDIRAAVFEPILRGTELLGVLAIAWSERRDALTPRESSVIRLLAAEMATIIERARLTAQLRELARTDPLTGLANRRVWDERIEIELTHAKRFSNPLCIALVDVDHFKPYNDTYGHQAGDRLLSAATAAWTGELRSGDLMARVGGDEFAVLLPDCDLEGGQALVERLRMATPAGVGCSVGIVQWDGEEPALEAISRADAALYAAKESGRARSVAG